MGPTARRRAGRRKISRVVLEIAPLRTILRRVGDNTAGTNPAARGNLGGATPDAADNLLFTTLTLSAPVRGARGRPDPDPNPETLMRQWLHTLFARKSPPARRLTRFRPGLESLEDRLTPSATIPGRLFNAPMSPPTAGTAAAKAAPAHTTLPRAKAAPALVSIRSPDATTLVLRFNRKLGRGAGNPASYKIPGLIVLRAKVSKDRKSV